MPLPPDPHDDDLTGPYHGAGADDPPAPPAPPPRPAAPSGTQPDDVAPLANAAAALGRDLGRPTADAMTQPGGGPPPPPGSPPAPSPLGRYGPDDLDDDQRGRSAAAPPPRRRRLVLVAAAVVIAGVVAVAALALAGGDDEPTSSGDNPAATGDAAANRDETPVEAAEAMFTAAIAGDCEGVVARLTPEAYGPDGESVEQAVAACESDADQNLMLGAELQDVTLVSETGDSAVVAVTASIGGESGSTDVPMRRVDGAWRVDLPR